MKMTTSPRAAFASLLGVSLLTIGAVAAQTTVFYSDAGSGSNAAAGGVASNGNLASINYDSWQYRVVDGNLSDGGTIGARVAAFPVSALFQNYTAAGLPTTLGGDPLQSVTLYLYAESVNPNGTNPAYTVYDSINGTGNPITPLILNADVDGIFFSYTLSAAQFLGGFSIGATMPNGALNVSTEEHLTDFQTPGLSATYSPVPEPTVALLGAVGALGLLRRRRHA